jgi:hypothetical protein
MKLLNLSEWAVLCVVCGLTTAAARRPGGVFVVPVTALKNQQGRGLLTFEPDEQMN